MPAASLEMIANIFHAHVTLSHPTAQRLEWFTVSIRALDFGGKIRDPSFVCLVYQS